MVIYRDPKKSWDSGVAKFLLEEIKEQGFNNFVKTDPTMEEVLEKLLEYI